MLGDYLADGERKIPSGFRFIPTPADIVGYYLFRYLRGLPLRDTHGIIWDADVYGADPDTLTNQYAPANNDGHWFFFSQCKRQSQHGTRMSRIAGDGTWHAQQSVKPVEQEGDGVVIGYRQNFRYVLKDGTRTQWLMEEYGSYSEKASEVDMVHVLCKVYRSPRTLRDDTPTFQRGSAQVVMAMSNAALATDSPPATQQSSPCVAHPPMARLSGRSNSFPDRRPTAPTAVPRAITRTTSLVPRPADTHQHLQSVSLAPPPLQRLPAISWAASAVPSPVDTCEDHLPSAPITPPPSQPPGAAAQRASSFQCPADTCQDRLQATPMTPRLVQSSWAVGWATSPFPQPSATRQDRLPSALMTPRPVQPLQGIAQTTPIPHSSDTRQDCLPSAPITRPPAQQLPAGAQTTTSIVRPTVGCQNPALIAPGSSQPPESLGRTTTAISCPSNTCQSHLPSQPIAPHAFQPQQAGAQTPASASYPSDPHQDHRRLAPMAPQPHTPRPSTLQADIPTTTPHHPSNTCQDRPLSAPVTRSPLQPPQATKTTYPAPCLSNRAYKLGSQRFRWNLAAQSSGNSESVRGRLKINEGEDGNDAVVIAARLFESLCEDEEVSSSTSRHAPFQQLFLF